MKSILSVASLTTVLLVGTFAFETASASAEKCENLYLAMKEYDDAKEAWLSATTDASSIERTKDAVPLLKKLARQRAEIKEARAERALIILKESLSMIDTAKGWTIPEYKGLANHRHLQFFIIAADVACS